MLILIFQLVNIAGSVLERPVIRKQFMNRYARIIELLNMELSVVEVLFNRGTRGALTNLPPLAAALTFTSMLKQRVDLPIQLFKAMPHPYV
jgi:dynein heavy chain